MGLVDLGLIYVRIVIEFFVFSWLLFGNLMKLFGWFWNLKVFFGWLLGFWVGKVFMIFLGRFLDGFMFWELYLDVSGKNVIVGGKIEKIL